MTTWHNLTAAELATETAGHISSQTSEPVPVAEIQEWIEANRGEVEGYMLAPHSIAHRILAERDVE